MGFNIVEDAAINAGGCRNCKAPVGVKHTDPWPCLSVQTAVSIDLKSHEAAPALINPPGGNILLRQAKCVEFLSWQVKAACSPIFADVAQDIR
jgi:hypothetical protein